VKFDDRPTFPEPPSWRAVAEMTMFSTDDGDPTAEAHVCALLEIADQMRIANLISLAKVMSPDTGASKQIASMFLEQESGKGFLRQGIATILGVVSGDAK
jgi:hypothetical protein